MKYNEKILQTFNACLLLLSMWPHIADTTAPINPPAEAYGPALHIKYMAWPLLSMPLIRTSSHCPGKGRSGYADAQPCRSAPLRKECSPQLELWKVGVWRGYNHKAQLTRNTSHKHCHWKLATSSWNNMVDEGLAIFLVRDWGAKKFLSHMVGHLF